MSKFADMICQNHSHEIACQCGRAWLTHNSVRYELKSNRGVSGMHWTDEEFIKLAEKGYKYGFLKHSGKTAIDSSSADFKGANSLNDVADLAGGATDRFGSFDGARIFYGLSPAESCQGMPPHHHYMAFIFPKGDSEEKPQWWVLGYVVELWRYGKP